MASVAFWCSSLFVFVANVVAARALGPSDYGRVVLAITITSLIATFLDLTLEEGLIHFGSAALAHDDRAEARSLFRTGLVADLVIGVCIFVAVVASASVLSRLLAGGGLDPDLVRLAAVLTLVSTADGTTAAALSIVRRWDVRAFVQAGSNLARIGLVWAASRSGGPVAVLAAMVVSAGLASAIQGAVAWLVAWRHWERDPTRRPAVGARALIRFGAHSSLTSTVIATSSLVVPLVLAHLLGTRAVGLFDVALLPVVAAGVLTGPLRTAVLSEHARLWARREFDTLRRSIRLYGLGVLIGGGAGIALGWIALPRVVPLLYTSTFDAAVEPARILLIAAAAQLLTGFAKTVPVAIGRPGIRTAVSALELVATIILMLLLADEGVTGAAVALSVATTASALCWWVIIRRITAPVH